MVPAHSAALLCPLPQTPHLLQAQHPSQQLPLQLPAAAAAHSQTAPAHGAGGTPSHARRPALLMWYVSMYVCKHHLCTTICPSVQGASAHTHPIPLSALGMVLLSGIRCGALLIKCTSLAGWHAWKCCSATAFLCLAVNSPHSTHHSKAAVSVHVHHPSLRYARIW